MPHVHVIDPGQGLPLVETLRLPARVKPYRHILIVPGNPGSAGFYVAFMRSLQQAFDGRAEVVAMSFPGHDMRSGDRRFLSLQETIELVAAVVSTMPSDTLVIGHSIGAYMAIHACPTHRIMAVFPFLVFDAGCRHQRLLRLIVSNIKVARLIMALVRCLPLALRHALVRRAVGHQDGVQAALRFLEDRSIAATCTLARHEFAELSSFVSVPETATIFYTANDRWFPDAHRRHYQARAHVKYLPGAVHAFCIDSRQSHQVAVAIVASLDK